MTYRNRSTWHPPARAASILSGPTRVTTEPEQDKAVRRPIGFTANLDEVEAVAPAQHVPEPVDDPPKRRFWKRGKR